jgi:hypothetical protein
MMHQGEEADAETDKNAIMIIVTRGEHHHPDMLLI